MTFDVDVIVLEKVTSKGVIYAEVQDVEKKFTPVIFIHPDHIFVVDKKYREVGK